MNRYSNFQLADVGVVLRRARAFEGISSHELANRLQWPESRLLLIERDAVTVYSFEIEQIGAALNQVPNSLLFSCIKRLYPTFVMPAAFRDHFDQ